MVFLFNNKRLSVIYHTYHLPLSPDVDECETDSCTHGCLNTYGSFMCTCDEGFELASDGTTCNGNQGREWECLKGT